jgi:diaminopimelate decarboxylase
MYGSYHGISVLGPDGRVKDRSGAVPVVVAGPLCESGDVFTQTRDGVVAPVPLPPVDVGDMLVFHDAGAYGASMSSCYNSRPLAAEVLIDGGEERLIRRRQRLDELLALEGMGDRAG